MTSICNDLFLEFEAIWHVFWIFYLLCASYTKNKEEIFIYKRKPEFTLIVNCSLFSQYLCSIPLLLFCICLQQLFLKRFVLFSPFLVAFHKAYSHIKMLVYWFSSSWRLEYGVDHSLIDCILSDHDCRGCPGQKLGSQDLIQVPTLVTGPQVLELSFAASQVVH